MRAEVIADRHSKANAIRWIAIGSVARVQRRRPSRSVRVARSLAQRVRTTPRIFTVDDILVSLSRSPSANERSRSSNLAIVGTLNARNRASYAAETYVSARLRANCRPSIAVFVSLRESLPFFLHRSFSNASKRAFIRFLEILAKRANAASGGITRVGFIRRFRASNLARSLISCESSRFSNGFV